MPTATEDRPEALVLASSQGLGFAVASRLAQDGYRLILHSRGGGALEQAEARIDNVADTAQWDLTKAGATARGIDLLIAAGHRPRVLVCNCGGPDLGSFEDLTREQWQAGLNAVLLTVTESVSRLRAVMRGQGGRVVIISSLIAREPDPNLTLSSVLRAGLSALVKCMAATLADDAITVNAVLPGYMETERLLAFSDKLETIRKRTPLGRFGFPGELAGLVSYLASAEAGFITGQSILCDGGMVRGS